MRRSPTQIQADREHKKRMTVARQSAKKEAAKMERKRNKEYAKYSERVKQGAKVHRAAKSTGLAGKHAFYG